jgi:3',5'-cyclic AMP phosphodiesterase CpdA
MIDSDSAEVPIRLAQISDVHVYRHAVNPLQFFSKQWIGNLNILLNRRFKFHRDPKYELVAYFEQLNVRHVIISGDLTSTSLAGEFEVARQFVEALEKSGFRVHLVPGNHDNYTKRAFRKKKFYSYFGPVESDPHSPAGELNLADHRLCLRDLGSGWWWVGLDTTVAAGMLRSNGEFDLLLQARLSRALGTLPAESRVVMTNHFPLTTTHPSHDMKRLKSLRELLVLHPTVKLYLHGHIHKQAITDGRPASLPLLLNSGSCGLMRGATCHIIDLLPDSCRIQVHRHTHPHNPVASGHWELQREVAYGW